MRKSYTVAPGHEFNYPTGASVKIIESAGGRSKLSEEDKAKVNYKTVKEGDDCSDMPISALELYLSRDWVICKESEKLVETEVKK